MAKKPVRHTPRSAGRGDSVVRARRGDATARGARGDATVRGARGDATLDESRAARGDATLDESWAGRAHSSLRSERGDATISARRGARARREPSVPRAGRGEEPARAQDRKARLLRIEKLLDAAVSTERLPLLLEQGRLWRELGAAEAAAQAYREALDLAPASAPALDGLEALHLERGTAEELVEQLVDRAEQLEAGADQAALLHRVARLYQRLDEPDKAVIALEAAGKADPGNAAIAAELEELGVGGTATIRRPARPRDELEVLRSELKAAQGDASRAEIYQRMAAVHEQRGDLSELSECLERVLTLDPKRHSCYRQLERCYEKTDQPDALARVLRRHAEVAAREEKAGLLRRLAELYQGSLADAHQAKEVYERLLALEPDSVHALRAIARLGEATEDWEAMARALHRLAKEEQAPHARAELLYRLACLQLERLHDAEAGEARLLEAVGCAPGHLKSVARLHEIYGSRGDWAKAVRLMLQAEAQAPTPLERARLLYQAGRATLEELGDEERGTELLARVLTLDPDHAPAARRLSDLYWRQGRHEANLPVLELLLRKTDPAERDELKVTQLRLGTAAESVGDGKRARQHYREALKLDPELLSARAALGRLLLQERRWSEARSAYSRLLDRRAELDPQQIVEALHALGVCHGEQGEKERATARLEEALRVDPSHRPSIDALLDLRLRAKDWEGVIDLKIAQLEDPEAAPAKRMELLREVAQIQWRELHQPDQAEIGLLKALELQPDHHGVLHDLIDLYAEEERWSDAVAMCRRMAKVEPDPKIRAKYYSTIAVIFRDRLDDALRALKYFNRVLDEDSSQLAAFEAIDKLCTSRRNWKQLADNYVRMIERLPRDEPSPLKVMLWHNLGEILRSRRREFEAAAAAFETAARLDPQNAERRRILAELYLSLGEEHVPQAIAAYHQLLRLEPEDRETYRRLRRLYLDSRLYDRAWCVSMALAFLQPEDSEVRGFFRQYRSQRIPRARRAMSEKLWRHNLLHPDQHAYLNSVFAIVTPVVAGTTTRPLTHYQLRPKDRHSSSSDDPPAVRIFEHATRLLGVTPADLYLCPDREEALLMAHTPQVPSFLMGRLLLECTSERELGFIIGKQLAHLRPEHFLRLAMPSKAELRAVMLAVLHLFNPEHPIPSEQMRSVGPLVNAMRRNLQPAALEQLGHVLHRHRTSSSTENGERKVSISRWWRSLELTSDRAGLVLSNDLEIAAAKINAEPRTGELGAAERVKQLTLYAASEEYFVLRSRLGITIEE